MILSAFLLLIPVVYEKYDKFIRLARALKEVRVGFILLGLGTTFSLLIAFITTISAWTEAGCKNADNDPNASKGDDFKKGLGGWCSTKKAGAIFFWLAFGVWAASFGLAVYDWRTGKSSRPRDPPFQHPTEYDEAGDEESTYEAIPAPRRSTLDDADESPFSDANRYSGNSASTPPATGGFGAAPSRYDSPPAAQSRPSMDAYGAFSDPAPTGFGAPSSEPNSDEPRVSRTMQYADPYAAVPRRMPSAEHDPPSQPGILSSVFGFISREVENFVTSATGGVVVEVSEKPVRPNSHARKTYENLERPPKKHSRRYEEEGEEERRTRKRGGRQRVRPSTPVMSSPSQQESPDVSPSPSLRKRPLSAPVFRGLPPRRPDTQNEQDQPALEPAPVSRTLRRCPSITMPGSLFPRSPSMETDESGNVGDASKSRVHFALDVNKVPEKRPGNARFGTPDGDKLSEAGPSSPISLDASRRNTTVANSPKSPSRLRPGSLVDGAVRRFSDDADPSLLLPSVQISPSGNRFTYSKSSKGKERALYSSDVEQSPEHSSWKGKERTYDYLEPIHPDSSGEIRVRGKERELSAVREEQRERERHWEREADTSEIYAEKHGYEEKIKLLEEEVRRLKAELAKRPTTSSTSHSYVPHLIPPPPPPPPPPLPRVRGRVPTAAETASLFASVRANLKHTRAPVEAPINSAVYGGASRVKRKGQPTVNVPSDKMAAFLTEMKTVRLRKVNGGPADMNSFASRSTGVSDFSRSVSGIGEKRKWDGYVGEEVQAAKRRLTMGSASTTLTFSSENRLLSQSFSGLPSSRNVSGPSALSQSLPPSSHVPTRNWPPMAADITDLTTPSLTSDGDHEGETSPEDRLPPTPPMVPISDIRGPIRVPSINKPLAGEEIADVSMLSPMKIPYSAGAPAASPSPPRQQPPSPSPPPQQPSHPSSPPQQPLSSSPPPQQFLSPPPPSQNVLDKRLPTSPIPAGTPKRPKPPARSHIKTPFRPSLPRNDSDDPLALAAVAPDPIELPASKEKGKGRAAPAKKPSRIPMASRKISSKPREAGVPSARNASRATSTKARRRTLDEELRSAEGGLHEEEDQEEDLDDELLIGVGTRSKKKGFLAHGGAGGQPVFMGVGYVEGAEDESEEGPEEWEEEYIQRKSAASRSRR
ncbi:hypothetical protein EW146_g4009 [Bondarzewia mesenterica]|uniref:Uncharacterized protein n=1 Tax=Bondarzewia mesenterica TaxID=1095465 RepID=A0A4V3XFA2_9AGAM|nr:hypothetical protein EW146_g4009 [Bondarzewia mesenterica]